MPDINVFFNEEEMESIEQYLGEGNAIKCSRCGKLQWTKEDLQQMEEKLWKQSLIAFLP